MSGDYEHYAEGTAIGLSIQRLLEITKGAEGNEWYKQQKVVEFVQKMTNLKTCSTNGQYDVTPCDANQCNGECKTWYSFYGEIEVQEDLWINSIKKGGVGQLLPNNTYIY